MKSFEKEYRDFKKELEDIESKRISEYKTEKLRIVKGIAKSAFHEDEIYIDGSQMHTFARNNPHIVGNQIFDVIHKETGNNYKAFYFSTENAFVDIFDDSIWYQNEENDDWEYRLDCFIAKPIFIGI